MLTMLTRQRETSSLKSDERKRRSTSAITRPNITYKNDASTSTSHHRRSQRHYGLAAIKRPIPTHDRVLAPHTLVELARADSRAAARRPLAERQLGQGAFAPETNYGLAGAVWASITSLSVAPVICTLRGLADSATGMRSFSTPAS